MYMFTAGERARMSTPTPVYLNIKLSFLHAHVYTTTALTIANHRYLFAHACSLQVHGQASSDTHAFYYTRMNGVLT